MSSNRLIDDFVLYTGCWKPYCRTKFHLGCSVGREVINRHDIFMSSCWTHSRRQGGVATAHAQCGVCGWGVAGAEEDFQSLVTPCCGSRHHRDCLQVTTINPAICMSSLSADVADSRQSRGQLLSIMQQQQELQTRDDC